MLKRKLLRYIIAGVAAYAAAHGALQAQALAGGAVEKLWLEARADIEAHPGAGAAYGVHGRYFNLIAGGRLGQRFGYYLRQRLKAEPGSIDFFDNTDFLHVSYQASPRLRLRLGKDALAMGGYEYDAPPIDVYMPGEYWNNIYCFQLGASAAYTTADSRHTFTLQAAQSPYVNSQGLDWDAGLLSYHLLWNGTLGEHWQTLWSASLMERQRGTFVNIAMLGTRATYGGWSLYLDLMHHALAWDDWGRNLGFVARMDWKVARGLTLMARGSYERNGSEVDLQTAQWLDQLVPAGHAFFKGFVGAEYRPEGAESVRLHAYAGMETDKADGSPAGRRPAFNLGATWGIDFARLLQKN